MGLLNKYYWFVKVNHFLVFIASNFMFLFHKKRVSIIVVVVLPQWCQILRFISY